MFATTQKLRNLLTLRLDRSGPHAQNEPTPKNLQVESSNPHNTPHPFQQRIHRHWPRRKNPTSTLKTRSHRTPQSPYDMSHATRMVDPPRNTARKENTVMPQPHRPNWPQLLFETGWRSKRNLNHYFPIYYKRRGAVIVSIEHNPQEITWEVFVRRGKQPPKKKFAGNLDFCLHTAQKLAI